MFKILRLSEQGFSANPGLGQYVTVRTGSGEGEDAFGHVLLGDFRTFMTQVVNTRIDDLADEVANNSGPSIWPVARTLTLGGLVGGSVSFDGSQNFSLVTTVEDGALSIAKTAGLQAALDSKLATTGNAATATRLQTSRNIALTGVITGTASFNGSANASIATSIADDALTFAKVAGLQAALDGKASLSGATFTGSVSMRGSTVDIWAVDTNTNPGVTVRGNAGLEQGSLIWDRTSDSMRLRRASADGATTEGELAVYGDRVSFNGATLYHTGNLNAQALSYLSASVTEYASGAGGDCNSFAAGTKNLVHNTNANTPGSSSAYWYIETLLAGTSTNSLIQRAYSASIDEHYFRRCTAGVWSNWRRQWNSGNFDPTSKLDSNAVAASATKLQTARTVALTGSVTGTGTFDGTANLSIATTIADASLSVAKVSGLQTALDDKLSIGQYGVGGSVANYNWAAEVRQSQFAVGTTGSPESGKNYMGMHVVLNHADYYALDVVGRNNKLWFKTVELGTQGSWLEVYHTGNFNPSNYTLTTRSVLAGSGITGGGTLGSDVTLTLGTPSTLSGSTTNAVTAGSHTHALSANLKAWDAITVASKLDASATAVAATKLATARTVALTGLVTATGSFDGTANLSLATSIADAALSIAKVSGLQTALDALAPKNNPTFTGTARLNGDLLPDADNTRSLGAPNLMWKDVYIGPGSLYINGQKVLEDNSGTIRMLADPNQNIAIQTSGSGDIELAPTGTGVIQMKGTLSLLGGSKIRSSNGAALLFDDDIQFTTGTGLVGTPTVNGFNIYHAGNLDLSTKLDVTGNAATATRLLTARNIALTGIVTGTASFNGSANASIATSIADNALTIAKVSGLQTALNTIGTTLDGKPGSYYLNTDQMTAGANLSPNGSFENRSPINNDRPQYYALGGTATGRSNSFVPSSVGPAGNAFRMDASTVTAGQYFDIRLDISDGDVRPTATPKRRYVASTDFRGTVGGTFQMYIQFYNAADAVIATVTSPEYAASEDWQRATCSGVAPALAVKVRAYPGRLYNKGSSTLAMFMEVDNHMLAEGDVATNYMPHAKDTYTDGEVLAKLLTVDGVGSGLDADLFGGLTTAQFMRLDAGNSGNLRINSGDGRGVRFWDSDSYKIYMSAADTAGWGGRLGETTSNHNMYFRMAGGTNRGFVFGSDTTPVFAINPTGVTSAVSVTAPSFVGNVQGATTVTVNNPSNTAANTTLGYTANGPRLRIGGSGTGADATFTIEGVSDFKRMSLDKNGSVVFPGSVTAGSFIGNISNADSAAKLATARTIALTGVATGSASFDGSANVSIATSVADGSLSIASTSGLQAALDGKMDNGAFGLGTVSGGYNWASTERISRFTGGLTNGPIADTSVMGFRSTLNNAQLYAASFVGRNNRAFFQTIENATVQAWNELYHTGNFNPADYLSSGRTVTAGNGLTGGGALTANITLTMGTPGTLSGSTTNAVTSTSHTHALSANLKLWDAQVPTSYVAPSATKLAAARTVTFSGDLVGNYSFDGSADQTAFTRVRSVAHGGTGTAYANQWTRICRATLMAQYEDAAIKFLMLGYGDGSTAPRQATVLFRVKQQNTLPALPYVNVEVESQNYLTPDAFVAVIGDTTSYPITVDLYVKMAATYSGLKSTVLARGGSRTLDMLDADGYIATLPEGTQVVGERVNLRMYTKALEITDTLSVGAITGTGDNTWTGTNYFNAPNTHFGATNTGNTILEIGGRAGTATTVGLDFHSSGSNNDFDSRISATGGTGTNGAGKLTASAIDFGFTGTVTLVNDKLLYFGSSGAAMRGTSTGSIVLASGVGASGNVYLRPNGESSTTGQAVVYTNGVLDANSLKANNSGAGAVMLELSGERAWQFRQSGTAATSALELFDVTGGKRFDITSTSSSNKVSIDPNASRVSANEFVGSLTGNASTATNASTVGNLAAGSFLRSDSTNSVDVRLASGDGRGLRFWDNDNYKISMSAATTANTGGRITGETTSDYNMYFRMSSGTNRGFVFEASNANKIFAINPNGVRSVVGMYAPGFTGPLIGNADTATKLATARTINGVSFDGSANITINAAWAGGNVNNVINIFNGTINSQASLLTLGWGTGSTRWAHVFEGDATYSLYSYNASGGNPLRVAWFANLAGGGNSFSAFGVEGGIRTQGASAGLNVADRTGGSNGDWSIYASDQALRFWYGGTGASDKVSISSGGEVGAQRARLIAEAPLHFTFGNGSLSRIYAWGTGGAGDDMFNVLRNGTSNYNLFWNGNMEASNTLRVGNQLYLNGGWFRTQQSGCGWYHEVHGGGWFMQDNTWIRTYNGKGVLITGASGNDGGLRMEGPSPTVTFYDTDSGRTNWLHCNDDNIGFLASNSFSWATYRNGSNDWVCIGNIVGYSSDERLKHHIYNVDRAIPTDFFDRFVVREFDWNYDAIAELNPDFKPIADHEVGAVAQEVEKVYPFMVTTHEHTGIKTIMWDKAVPLLISEVQELRKLKPVVDELLQRIAALEAKTGGG